MNNARVQSVLVFIAGVALPFVVGAQCLPCERAANSGFVPDTTGQSSQFQVRRAGAEVNATRKIEIGEDGWYQVTQAQLLSAGFASSNLIGSELRLFNYTQEVASAVSTDGLFGPGDVFNFYALAYDGVYSRSNAYWLGFGGVGKHISSTSGAIQTGAPALTTMCYRVRYNPKVLYRAFHEPLDTSIDHWFAALIGSTSDSVFTVSTTNRMDGSASLSIRLYGLSVSNHQTRIRVNGNTLGTGVYSGAIYHSTNFTFASATLSNGPSALALRELVAGESVYMIDATLDYPGQIHATGPEYYFCGAPGTNVYRVTGLATNSGIWLLDVTRAHAPVHVLNAEISTNGSGSYALRFEYASDAQPRFLVVQPAGVRTSPAPREIVFRNLADAARQADYLMICPYELRQQAYRLAKHHFTNKLNVAVAPLPDIYDEFGYGIVDASAIKQFIGYAYHHWAPPHPRFAVLIGKGTDDPRGYNGSVPPFHVPVKFGPTPYVVAAEDTWYGLVDGNDVLADVAVGRITVSSNAQLSNVVNKIIAYEGAPIVSNALLVADNDGQIDFAGSSNTNIDNILAAGGFSRTKVYMPFANARGTIQATINNGRRLVTYVGHGGVDRWSFQNIWNTNDVLNLTNSVYPVVAIFSCNSAAYLDRNLNCLAEMFIEAPHGASSTFAPTALAVQIFSDYVAAGFSTAFAIDKRRRLGDVVLDAQLNLFNWNPNVAELLTYQIIGDPGLIVNSP